MNGNLAQWRDFAAINLKICGWNPSGERRKGIEKEKERLDIKWKPRDCRSKNWKSQNCWSSFFFTSLSHPGSSRLARFGSERPIFASASTFQLKNIWPHAALHRYFEVAQNDSVSARDFSSFLSHSLSLSLSLTYFLTHSHSCPRYLTSFLRHSFYLSLFVSLRLSRYFKDLLGTDSLRVSRHYFEIVFIHTCTYLPIQTKH